MKKRANRCGETCANAPPAYVPARALSMAIWLRSVAKISIGKLTFAAPRNSIRQMAIE